MMRLAAAPNFHSMRTPPLGPSAPRRVRRLELNIGTDELGLEELSAAPGDGNSSRLMMLRPWKGRKMRTYPPKPCGRGARAMKTVLVVEDDPDIRDLVIWKLNQAGYATLAEADGEAGLAAAGGAGG